MKNWLRIFNVSVPTIRLDRLELGILNCVNVYASWLRSITEMVEHVPYEVVGELIDVTEGQQALSMLRTTSGHGRSIWICRATVFICSNKFSSAKVVMGTTVCSAEVGNIKYKNPVGAGTNLVAKAEIVRRRGNKFFIWVIIRDKIKEVFRAKFIMESVENRV